MKRIRSLLVANRSEIAIRVFRAATELGIRTVAVFANEDRFSLHRFKADESYLVGAGLKPIAAYLDIGEVLRVAREADVDAIHPGYGFLSENPDFAAACESAGLVFVGPSPQVLRTMGNKVAARNLAVASGVPVVPATGALPQDLDGVLREARAIGYPLMLKASWGGGGRGMRAIESEDDLASQFEAARREAVTAFGNGEVYLERLVRRARHVEVQILGDSHGNLVHLYERDCSVQRRNQKVVERAPAPYLDEATRQSLCESALRLARAAGFTHAGTVEFLMDADSGAYYFIEVNPRIQVEHTVTEQITGVDIVKAQIRVSEGGRIGDDDALLPAQPSIRINGHAVQCRITTEDPEKGFAPDYGRLTAYRSAAGFGLRLDGGTAYTGAVITPFYDSLLVKVTAWGHTVDESIARMHRALGEFRIRGVTSNLQFLENVIAHPQFRKAECTTRFIDTTPELFKFQPRRDRATKLLRFLGEVAVNGNPEMKGRKQPLLPLPRPVVPACDRSAPAPAGARDRLRELGASAFARWMLEQPRVLLTDTTMRDAHQSLFATRMRTADMVEIAPCYARRLAGLFSVECWGGATFDVAMRFLKEDPWERLARLREAMPNLILQVLVRGANAVGYTSYPDNVVRYFVRQSAAHGIDLFRVFDSMNWIENTRVTIDAVLESGALCEASLCYTADLFDPGRPKFGLNYYLQLARQIERSGAHILCIKDMAGVCRPRAARELVRALKQEVGMPIHFHTHDTSGMAAASVLAAIEAGADAVDGAIDSMSGLTSQPNLGAIIASLAGTERMPEVDTGAMQEVSYYWEGVRRLYEPFEPDLRAPTSDVYLHEMPGGQVTNLREQARAMGLDHRWPEVARAYAQVNRLFGDIVKVTPTSKVVGDMALFMVANDLSERDVLDPEREINFPDSVVALFKGELGLSPEGFPSDLQKKVLKGQAPLMQRAGDLLPHVDLDAARIELESHIGRHASDTDLASYLMYPKVFRDFAEHQRSYGDVSPLPTSAFFYGLHDREEIAVSIDKGKTLIVRQTGRSDQPDDEGLIKVFFELNGQQRLMRIAREGAVALRRHAKIDPGNPAHVGAPMPGAIVTVTVHPGQRVTKGTPIASIEAMKMETVLFADRDATVASVHVKPGDQVEAKDLLIALSA
ncbi:MAG: pyruvate carboxylase [Betaproteobacteria bacterium]|nr:MAG: pyruvate carboxylase [Betaproteobacteria bacterium]